MQPWNWGLQGPSPGTASQPPGTSRLGAQSLRALSIGLHRPSQFRQLVPAGTAGLCEVLPRAAGAPLAQEMLKSSECPRGLPDPGTVSSQDAFHAWARRWSRTGQPSLAMSLSRFLGQEWEWALGFSFLTAVCLLRTVAPAEAPIAPTPLVVGTWAGGRAAFAERRWAVLLCSSLQTHPSSCLCTGFDLMDLFNVKDILGRRENGVQSSYVRMGSYPVVQRTE